jgi:hypothetical protein
MVHDLLSANATPCGPLLTGLILDGSAWGASLELWRLWAAVGVGLLVGAAPGANPMQVGPGHLPAGALPDSELPSSQVIYHSERTSKGLPVVTWDVSDRRGRWPDDTLLIGPHTLLIGPQAALGLFVAGTHLVSLAYLAAWPQALHAQPRRKAQ